MIKNSWHRSAWIWVLGVSVGTAVLLQIPYLLGYLTTQEGQFYTGLIMNPEDSQTYWAKMTQGLQGAWAYTIPFTTEPHEPAYVGIFYVWLGQLARLTGLSLTAVWHGSRFVADVVLFGTVYWFVGLFMPENGKQSTINEKQSTVNGQQSTENNSQLSIINYQLFNGRKLAFLLALFGSGLGWLLFILQAPYWLNTFPIDFKQPGAHLFFTAMTFPHITLGTAFILLSIGLMARLGKEERRKKKEERGEDTFHFSLFTFHLSLTRKNLPTALLFGLSNLLLGIAYPFLIYIVAGTAVFYGLYLIWQKREIPWLFGGLTAVAFLIPAPLYLYYVKVLGNNAVFKAWDVQAITPAAPWPHYLVAFGPYLWLIWIHLKDRTNEKSDSIILYCWILSVILLLYAPLNPQRRFVQGVQVPLAILSSLVIIQTILPKWIKSARWQKIVARPRYETGKLARLLMVIFLLTMSISNIYLWADVVRTAVLVQPDPLFRQSDEQAAADWLRENTGPNEALFGSMQTGNLIAAQTARPVFVGHWAETVDFDQKRAQSIQFFAAETSNGWRQQLLADNQISYVWIGPRENRLGNVNPESFDFLTQVYHNHSITIYQLKDEG